MFEARHLNQNTFKNVIATIKEIVDEVSLDISKEGIKLHATDASNVMIVMLYLKACEFEHFSCDKP